MYEIYIQSRDAMGGRMAFRFWLVDAQPQFDIFSYNVSKDDSCILLIIFGIDTSYCNIFKRQPSSLLASTAHIVFNLLLNLERLELTKDITYQQYLYAVNSNRVSNWKLIPPEYPALHVQFRFCCPRHRLHHECPGMGTMERVDH